MKTTRQQTLLAVLSLAVSVLPAGADNSEKTKAEHTATATLMVGKLHSDVKLSTEQQEKITELTVNYFQERQQLLDAVEEKQLSELAVEMSKKAERELQDTKSIKSEESEKSGQSSPEFIYPASLTEDVIIQLGVIEERYQSAIQDVLNSEQQATAVTKQEERISLIEQEAKVSADSKVQETSK